MACSGRLRELYYKGLLFFLVCSFDQTVDSHESEVVSSL